MSKVLLIANVGFTITNFRSELICEFIKMGKTVKIVCPVVSDFDEGLTHAGVEIIPLDLSRRGINPFIDIKTLLQLLIIFKREQPDIVLNYTVKPVIFSSIAGWILKVPKVCSFVTGLGYVFTDNSYNAKLLRVIVSLLYRFAFKYNFRIFFQNNDDLELFRKYKLIKIENTRIINGSGVNLENFKSKVLEKINNSFVLVARLLKDKGIGEFVDAARIIKKKYPDTSFWLCGSPDDNPASFSSADVGKWVDEGVLTHICHTDDVKGFIENKEVFVLPSYREGTPRSVLEAMAMKMPIITTDAPGCRETTIDGENGFLVKIRSVDDLVESMEKFILKPELKKIMGEKSYQIAVEKYDVNKVNKKIIFDLEI